MQIIGYELIPHQPFVLVDNKEELDKVEQEKVCFFEHYDFCLLENASKKNLTFAVKIKSIKEAVLANGIGARFIVCSYEIASKIQEIAEYYLFDAKVAIVIDSEDEIEMAVAKKVDAVIFKGAIG